MTKQNAAPRKVPSRFSRSATAAQQPAAGPVDLASEYRYVVEDLKRIGIIAVVLVLLLIGLSLVIIR
ncbi:MAG: hypothetical protein IT326_01420 [Anaerolineae bacterium]|nr:hypothetical protein [Anaerolineae bacterium]